MPNAAAGAAPPPAATIFQAAGFAEASEATRVSLILGLFKLIMTGGRSLMYHGPLLAWVEGRGGGDGGGGAQEEQEGGMLWRPRRPGGGCCCCCSEAQRLLPHTPGLPCPTRLLPHTPGPPVPPLPGTQASLCPPHPWPPNPPLPSPSRHAGIAVAKVDSLGRRPLLLAGSSGMAVALLLLGALPHSSPCP